MPTSLSAREPTLDLRQPPRRPGPAPDAAWGTDSAPAGGREDGRGKAVGPGPDGPGGCRRPGPGPPSPGARRKRRPLTGLRVLVTGASSGIGAALSAQLAARGCRVAGTGRRPSGLSRAPSGPFEATVVRDLTEPGAPADVVAAAAGALGGLDVVISNAGAGWSGAYQAMTTDEVDAMLDINLRAPMHLARAAAPYLLGSEEAQLVFVGSIGGLVGVAEEVAYTTAKAGLKGLADSLREEWPTVTVTLVSPGPVQTQFFSRRNRPYERPWPKPVPAAAVAGAIVDVLERRRPRLVVPRWMVVAARLNGGLPGLYQSLADLADRFSR